MSFPLHLRTERGQDTPLQSGRPSWPEAMSDVEAPMTAPLQLAAPMPTEPLALVEFDDAEPLPWQEQALCAQTDPEAFFPEKGGSTREAKRVCSRCDVKGDCLTFALAHDERFGIWGGLSERERRRLKRRAV